MIKKYDDIEKLLGNLDRSKKIVFTNGCFDLFHVGHLDLLKQANAFGDILIVAINSDASVKSLKGINRPLFSLDHRMEILASLEIVDYIIPFSEATPLNLIKAILPDVLVKGADYKKEDIVGYHEVTEAGGSVETINFTYDVSTSKILNQIRSAKNED